MIKQNGIVKKVLLGAVELALLYQSMKGTADARTLSGQKSVKEYMNTLKNNKKTQAVYQTINDVFTQIKSPLSALTDKNKKNSEISYLDITDGNLGVVVKNPIGNLEGYVFSFNLNNDLRSKLDKQEVLSNGKKYAIDANKINAIYATGDVDEISKSVKVDTYHIIMGKNHLVLDAEDVAELVSSQVVKIESTDDDKGDSLALKSSDDSDSDTKLRLEQAQKDLDAKVKELDDISKRMKEDIKSDSPANPIAPVASGVEDTSGETISETPKISQPGFLSKAKSYIANVFKHKIKETSDTVVVEPIREKPGFDEVDTSIERYNGISLELFGYPNRREDLVTIIEGKAGKLDADGKTMTADIVYGIANANLPLYAGYHGFVKDLVEAMILAKTNGKDASGDLGAWFNMGKLGNIGASVLFDQRKAPKTKVSYTKDLKKGRLGLGINTSGDGVDLKGWAEYIRNDKHAFVSAVRNMNGKGGKMPTTSAGILGNNLYTLVLADDNKAVIEVGGNTVKIPYQVIKETIQNYTNRVGLDVFNSYQDMWDGLTWMAAAGRQSVASRQDLSEKRFIQAAETNPDFLVDKVQQLYDTDITELSKKSRKYIENNHNWEKSKGEFERILRI